MEKTIEVQLKEQRNALIEKIAEDFERKSRWAIESNEYSFNDCALMAKMYLGAAKEIRKYK